MAIKITNAMINPRRLTKSPRVPLRYNSSRKSSFDGGATILTVFLDMVGFADKH